MFILRKITGQGYEMNFILGNHYGLELRADNPEEFCKRFEDYIAAHGDEMYGMICKEDSTFLPLFRKHGNYVMTEGGATFANLSTYEYKDKIGK